MLYKFFPKAMQAKSDKHAHGVNHGALPAIVCNWNGANKQSRSLLHEKLGRVAMLG